jgi:uncharacterized OB-fold protein
VPGLFAKSAGGPALLASRCEECGELAFPRRQVCPRCKRFSTVPVEIGQRARLYSFTVCHAARVGWPAPYLQAYVELPEGLRVFTLVSSSIEPSAGALTIGMDMELAIEPVSGGDGPLTYKYRPASN